MLPLRNIFSYAKIFVFLLPDILCFSDIFFSELSFQDTLEINVQNHHKLTLQNVREYGPESYSRSACKTSMLEAYFTEGYKVPPEKSQSHQKSQFSYEMSILKYQRNFQTRLKSNFLLTPISNIYFRMFSKWLESS